MRTLGLIVGFSWIAFWLYWIAAAAHSGAQMHHGQRVGRLARLILFLPMAILIVLTVNGSGVNLGYEISQNRPWLKGIGLVLLYGGLALAIWARKYLGRNWGVPMAAKKDAQLVTGGPYKYIRHPIYTALILAPFGTFLILSISWLYVFLVGSAYFIYSAFQEDKMMAKQFPKTYPAYKRRTKMLIPYLL